MYVLLQSHSQGIEYMDGNNSFIPGRTIYYVHERLNCQNNVPNILMMFTLVLIHISVLHVLVRTHARTYVRGEAITVGGRSSSSRLLFVPPSSRHEDDAVYSGAIDSLW